MSSDVKGGLLRWDSENTGRINLAGCFVGKEFKPRFLLLLCPTLEVSVYFPPNIKSNEIYTVGKLEVADTLFEEGMGMSPTRLWRV